MTVGFLEWHAEDEKLNRFTLFVFAQQQSLASLYGSEWPERLPYLEVFVQASEDYRIAYCDFLCSGFRGESIRPVVELLCLMNEVKPQKAIFDLILTAE